MHGGYVCADISSSDAKNMACVTVSYTCMTYMCGAIEVHLNLCVSDVGRRRPGACDAIESNELADVLPACTAACRSGNSICLADTVRDTMAVLISVQYQYTVSWYLIMSARTCSADARLLDNQVLLMSRTL